MTTATATERRKQIHTLRCAGNDWPTICETMGLKESTCKAYFKLAVEQDGLGAPPDMGGPGSLLAERAPEQMVQAMTIAMDPFVKNEKEMREACKKVGMKPSMVNLLMQRLKAQYAPVVGDGQRMAGEAMKAMLEEKIWMGAQYLNELTWATMHPKDVGVVLTALIDRYELISGRPTQRIDFTARLQLQESMPLLLAEARRRGIELPMVEEVAK